MKPSEQLRRTNLVELNLQQEQALDDVFKYQRKLLEAKKVFDNARIGREEMLKAIKELESKGL